MTLESDIALLKRQEDMLQFERFTEADAWKLGSAMRALAAERGLPLVIDIRIGTRPLFYCALPGTTPENPDWVRRKVNSVYRFDSCSYRVGLEYRLKGNAFDASRGIDPMNFASAGGSFPIRIRDVGVVGAVTVSGVPQRQDHAFVAEAICHHLGQDYKSIALPDIES